MTYQTHLAALLASEANQPLRWFVVINEHYLFAYARFIEASGPLSAQQCAKKQYRFAAQIAKAVAPYYSVAAPDASLQNRVLSKQEFQSWESQNQLPTRTLPTSVIDAPVGGITPTCEASKEDS